MKTLGWLAALLLLFALSVLVVVWPDLKELRSGKNWQVTQVDQDSGELAGVRVSIDQQRAMILPGLEDRAIVYLRMGLQGDRDQMKTWLACDIGLTDPQGRKWLPLSNAAGIQIMNLLRDGTDYGYSCSQSLIMAPEDGSPSFSEQAFLVPVDVLGELRLELSGMMTRPKAISMPFRPVLHPPPG